MAGILIHLFAVHNKLKPKAATLPEDVMYFSGEDLGDVWVDYREFALAFACIPGGQID